MANNSLYTTKINQTKVGFPRLTVLTFTIRQNLTAAIIWGAVFAISAAATALGFVKAYPTQLERMQIIATLGHNAGIIALLGAAHQLDTVGGFTQWRSLGILTLIGAIYAFMMATKYLRGEEETGRTELFLAGLTTIPRLTLQTLAALIFNLFIAGAITTLALYSIGRSADVGIGLFPSILFGLTLVSISVVFLAVGALSSVLVPTRRQANLISTVCFGIFYLMRAFADATNHAWLKYLTPFGWAEEIQPLTSPRYIMFVPLILMAAVLIIITMIISARRDLNQSIIRDRDTATPKTRLLNSQFGLSFRLMFPALLAWIISFTAGAFLYASMGKSAADALSKSDALNSFLHKIDSSNMGVLAFLGVISMIFMIGLMVMAAAFASQTRDEESTGRLDALLARPVSRGKWLIGRLGLIIAGMVLTSFLIGFGFWFVSNLQNVNLDFTQMIYAGLNILPPGIFLLGIGIFIMGVLPRQVSAVTYFIIAFTFLIQIIASVVKAGDWLMKLSVLHFMSLSPAIDPNWHNNFIITAIGLILCLIGGLFFINRDLISE